MKQKYIFPLGLLVLYNHIYTSVEPITPGEPLYGIVSRIGTGIDEANSGISTIETQLQSLSGVDSLGSTIESLGSNIDQLVDNTNVISVQNVLLYNLESVVDSKVDILLAGGGNPLVTSIYDTVTEIDTKVDTINTKVNNVSAQNVLLYNLESVVDSKVDILLAGGGNPLVTSIYDTVTEIDTKVDTINTKVNNVSAQNVLLYNLESVVDSKVDILLAGGGNPLVTSIYDTVTEIDTKVDTINTKVNNVSAQNVLLYNLESVIDSKVDEIRSFPDFVQTPTAFQSQGINAQTSRYFFTKRTITGVTSTEKQVLSLRNDSVSTVVRISAVGCGMDVIIGSGAGSAVSTWVPLYKNATLSGESFSSFNPSSVLSINTAGTFTGGTQVYELQAGVGGNGVPRSFEYLPKELYSVIIAPGETLTVAVGMAASAADTTSIIIMWEEIISY